MSLLDTRAAAALDPSRALTQYVHRSWGIAQGLPQDSAQALAQTPDGYLWIGTQEGLVRFDGVRFTLFNSTNTSQLKSNNILSLLCDHAGTLWVGAGRGVATYRDGRFAVPAGGDNLFAVFAMAEIPEEGTMWLGSSSAGLHAYRQGRVTHVADAPQRIWALRRRGRTLWIGAQDGLWRRSGGKSTRIAGIDGPVYSLDCTPAGEVWAGGAGLWQYDGTRAGRPAPGFERDEIWALKVDRSGTLWVGTRRGLYRWSGGAVSRLTTAEGLSHDYVESLLEDAEGSLWVGTHLGGINQLLDGLFLPFTPREGLSDATVWAVAEGADGTIWAGTEEGGLNRFRDGVWTRLPPPAPEPRTPIISLAPKAGGGVWVGTYGDGLYDVTAGVPRRYTRRDGLPNDEVSALRVARDGSLWIGTTAGVARRMGGRIVSYGSEHGLDAHWITALHEDRRGRMWALTGDPGGPLLFEKGRFRAAPLAHRQPPDLPLCMYEDDRGDLWFGTRVGIYRMHGDRTFVYTAAHGLPAAAIGAIFEDGRGALWAGTARGLFRILRRELDDVMAGRARNVTALPFDIDDGLPAPEVATAVDHPLCRASDGRIWLATARGLAVLDPRAEMPALRSAPLIEEVRIDDAPAAATAHVSLDARHHRLAFRFTAPSLAIARRIRFRYRLEGYDDGWTDAGERRTAEYTSLPPGRYRFRVEATDGTRWIAARAAVAVERLPAVYQTWWFILLCAAALGLLIWLIHDRRIRTLRRQHEALHRERHRIARELHDALSSGVTGALLHIQSALDHAADDRIAEHLQTGKGLLTATVEETQRVLWDLRSTSPDSRDLGEAFTSMMEMMTRRLPIVGTVVVTGKPRRLDDPTLEHHLLRIGQEAVTNALRHSGAHSVTLAVEFSRSQVVLRVRDDGHGSGEFALDELAAFSHGLRGMRERAQQMQAKLTAHSVDGGGFEVVVEVEG